MPELPGACDCHFHVFGPAERYPAVVEESRVTRTATLDAYLGLSGEHGIERFVLVQPSTFGADNSCLLDALRRLGPSRARGVVMVARGAASDDQLEEWQRLGVRGVRVNCFRPGVRRHAVPLGAGDMLPVDVLKPQIREQAALAREMGWSLDLLVTGPLLLDLLPTLADLTVPFSVAHLGMFPAGEEPSASGFERFLEVVATPPRRCWVKATAPYRISPDPGFPAVGEMLREIMDAAPDRVIWGSDYPYLGFASEVDATLPFELLGAWLPDDARRRVLVDNPRELYGFDEPVTP